MHEANNNIREYSYSDDTGDTMLADLEAALLH